MRGKYKYKYEYKYKLRSSVHMVNRRVRHAEQAWLAFQGSHDLSRAGQGPPRGQRKFLNNTKESV